MHFSTKCSIVTDPQSWPLFEILSRKYYLSLDFATLIVNQRGIMRRLKVWCEGFDSKREVFQIDILECRDQERPNDWQECWTAPGRCLHMKPLQEMILQWPGHTHRNHTTILLDTTVKVYRNICSVIKSRAKIFKDTEALALAMLLVRECDSEQICLKSPTKNRQTVCCERIIWSYFEANALATWCI